MCTHVCVTASKRGTRSVGRRQQKGGCVGAPGSPAGRSLLLLETGVRLNTDIEHTHTPKPESVCVTELRPVFFPGTDPRVGT